MKKKFILIAVVLAALLLVGYRYSIVEQDDILPDEVRLTLRRLIGVAMAEGAQEPAAEQTPAPPSKPLLKRGDSGDEVRALQKRLSELGFPAGSADGRFGGQTEQAVIGFKRHIYDLIQEKQAREEAAHSARIARAFAIQESTLEAQKPDIPRELYEQEAALQAQIPSPSRAETEQEALLAAQIPERPSEKPSWKIEPVLDGTVDADTHHLLLGAGFDEYQARLSSGSQGAEVRRLQERLRALGYLTGRADGVFGRGTAEAVSAFQGRNNLTRDGVAGEQTQRLLFSSEARRQVKKPSKPYVLKISTADQRVYAYGWSESDEAHTKLVRTMVCSTGLADTPTPKGTFSANTAPVVRWGYFPKYDVWAQYLYRIQGPYLFHSVLYDEADESTVKWGSVNKLGSPASHGCIRLNVEDAKWIYENCPAGTAVTVY